MVRSLGDVLERCDNLLAEFELTVEAYLGPNAAMVSTWLFHGAVAFVLGLHLGVFGWGAAVGLYAYREVGHLALGCRPLDCAGDFLAPLACGALGVLV